MPQIFILSGTTTWTVPDDCVSVNVDTIGAGAGGDSVGGAGGGGAWSSIVGLAVTPKSTITVQVGVGGATGSVGGDTWFNGASLAAASVGAKGGGAPSTTSGGTGGQASGRPNSGNTSGNNGGNGGSVASANPGGGGGAGGLNGNGVSGSNGGVSLGGNGGAGDNGSGGAGGTGSAAGTNPGAPGTEYDGSHGSGGGGGGSVTATAGAGGNYGGGGGGSLVTGGAGANGLIVINYVSVFVNKRTTSAPWNVGLEEPSSWQFAAPYNQSLATSVLPKNVLRPPFYAPRPPDDFIGPRVFYNNLSLSASTAINPFKFAPWKFGYDDPSYWVGNPYSSNSVYLPVVLPQSTFYTVRPADDFIWKQTASNNLSLSVTPVNKPFTYTPWKFGYDDSSGWQGTPLASELLIPVTTAGGQIKWKREWLFGYDDSAFRSDLGPQPSVLLHPILTAAGQVHNKQWLFGYEDSSYWVGTPTSSQQPTLNLQPPPVQWKREWLFGYDDPGFWQGKPLASDLLVPILTSVGQVKWQREWLFSYDDPAFWQADLSSNQLIIAPAQPPVKFQRLWLFGYDDHSYWIFDPQPSRILTPSVGQIKFQREWLFGYDDPAFRSDLGPQSSKILAPILTAGGRTKSKQWLFGYDDPPFWSPILGRQMQLLSLPKAVPFTPPSPTFTYEDPAFWQYGYYARSNFPLIILPLIVDYNYICSPNASIPSNAGARRTFTTSPNASVPTNAGAARTFVTSPLTPNPLKKLF